MIKAPDVTLVYVVVCFLISYAILTRFLFRPLSRILEQREEEERMAAQIHSESLAELQKTIARAEQQLSLARREALKERETLRADGRTHFERKLAEARAAAGTTIEAARRQIEADSARSSAELPSRAAALARLLAEKVLGRKLAA